MEQKISEGRFTARPYVVASFGSASAEASALDDSWAFAPVDAGYCSAFFDGEYLRRLVDVVDAQDNRFCFDDEGKDEAVSAVEGLALWCAQKLISYPASNGGGNLVSSLCYRWEVWKIQAGEIRGVVGFAVPRISLPAASLAEMRQYVGMWTRSTFGFAFLPYDLVGGGWREVIRGSADRYAFHIAGKSWDVSWKQHVRSWSV